jgi:hypothetical protein
MKLKITLVLMILLCAVFANAQTLTTIFSDNFESYTVGSTAAANGYSTTNSAAGVSALIQNTVAANSGTKYVNFTGSSSGNQNGYLNKSVSVTAGKTYIFSLYTNAVSSKSHKMGCKSLTATTYTNNTWTQLITTYTATATENINLILYMYGAGTVYVDDVLFQLKQWNIAATSNNNTMGSVSGGGLKDPGTSVSLTATAYNGYRFVNWTEGGSPISTNANLPSFSASVDRTLVANYESNNLAVATVSVSQTTRTGFTYTYKSGPSSEQTFTVAGANLNGNISITAPTNYEISTTTGASFVATSPITLTQSNGSVGTTTIYVRLKAGLAVGNYNTENITISSTGVSNQNVACSGNVIPKPTLVWTGSAGDLVFFNEANWKNSATNTAPSAGTIDPGIAINTNLLIENVSSVIGGTSGISSNILLGAADFTIRKSTLKMAAGKGIDMGSTTNILTIDSAKVTSDFINNATTSIGGDSKLYLLNANPFNSGSTINITSNDAWIFAANLNAATAVSTHLPRVNVNGSALVDMTNGRITQYYNGCAMAAYSSSISPLRVFDAANLNGTYADISVQTIFSGTNIPSNLNDKIVSFKLKKGYMVTLAVENDGTGMSKVYIASETDLIINALPPALSGQISFIRVLPWIWVNKKGTAGNTANPKGSWFYDWGLSNSSSMDREFAAMCWGKTSLDTPAEQNTLINKKKITHIMSFNEADDCTGQSGQWGSLCVVDTAALWHKNSMKTGLRIVSPSCRENEELDWLKIVNTIMVPAGTRMDVIGMHWYDWGGLSSASDANSIFTRFKNRVIACYNYYKMPIWIDEFNANPARSTAIQDAFLQLALPWLESIPYVERYAYFQTPTTSGNFVDTNGNLTSTGTIYLNQVSTPSIPESYINYYNNNLQSRMNETPVLTNIVSNKERLKYQYNPATKQIFIKSESADSVKLYNLQGVCLKYITPNTNTILTSLPTGIYIVTLNGEQSEKIVVY